MRRRLRWAVYKLRRWPLPEDIPDNAWIIHRYPDRCHFYPGRDCPGCILTCARINERI